MKRIPIVLSCWMLVVAVVGCGAASNHAAKSDAAVPSADRVVVMISLDGLAGYYLDDPKAEMPTLRELAAKGARASGMRPSTPSGTSLSAFISASWK